ncbi:MAG TPA: CPBP family intramembrane glutamic endopeptidase [Longimicrobiales bacterium]
MKLDRSRVRSALIALLKLVLFAALFYVFQQVIASALLAVFRTGAFLLDTLATLGAAVLAGGLLLRALDDQPVSALGFGLHRGALRQLAVALALGVAGLGVAGVLLLLLGRLRYLPQAGTAGGWLGGSVNMLLALLIPAAAEEALFRGYPFQKLVQALGPVLATVAASAAFAIAHRHNPAVNGLALVNIFAAGVMLSVAFLRTRSLWVATGVHLGWNWSMAALLDLPVSGLELYDAPLYQPVDRGPGWLTGGAFGPEAGLAGLLGLLLVLGGIVILTRKTRWLT